MLSVARRQGRWYGKLNPQLQYISSTQVRTLSSEPERIVVFDKVDIFAEEEKDEVLVSALNNIMREQNVPFTPLFNRKEHEEYQLKLREHHDEVRRLEGYLKMKADTYGLDSITAEDKERLLQLNLRNPEIVATAASVDAVRHNLSGSSVGSTTVTGSSTGNAVVDAEMTPRTISSSRLRPLRSQMPEDVRKRLDELMDEAERRDLFKDEVRNQLHVVASLSGQEQIEAMRSLAILEEIVKLNNQWNRSSSAGAVTEQETSSASLWNPEYPTKPGQQDKDNAPKLSSYFSTDTSIPGRSFETQDVDNTFQSIVNKNSVYTAGQAKRAVTFSSPVGVEPAVKTVQNEMGVARDRLKKQPKGKLHAGQVRDLQVRHQLRGSKYTPEFLADIFDISALTVLEQIHQSLRKDVVSGAKIGGFAPLMYRLHVGAQSNHFGKVLRTLAEKGAYKTCDSGFQNRVAAVDADGYVRLYGNDVIIPLGSEMQVRPLLEKSLGLDRVRSSELKRKQLDGGDQTNSNEENSLPGIATTPSDAPVTSNRPSEAFQTTAENQSYLEYLVDELVQLRGKTMKQLFDQGQCKTTPYDSPVDEDGQVSGRYSFTEATKEMHMGLTREAVEGSEANRFLYGKYYHLSRVSRRGEERLQKKQQSLAEEADDYGLGDATLDTGKLDAKQKLADEHKKSYVHRVVEDVLKQDALKNPISRYAQLALVSAVLAKYSNHHSIIQDGINVIDDTIKAALEDGGIYDYDLEQQKTDSLQFPLLALQSLCETTHVPHMYKCTHRMPGVGTFVHGHFNAQADGYGVNLGMFHPDLVVATHRALTNRSSNLDMIDAFDSVEAIDRNGVLRGDFDDQMHDTPDVDTFSSGIMDDSHSRIVELRDIEDLADFEQFVRQVPVDEAKRAHMLQYKHTMESSGLDIAHNATQAGIFDTYKPAPVNTTKNEQIVDVEPEGDKFAGHKKELFGGPVAVKAYLDIISHDEVNKKKQ